MNTKICSKQTRCIEGHSGFVYSLHVLLTDILPGLLVEKVLKNRRQAKLLEQPNPISFSAVLMSPCGFLFSVKIEILLPLPVIYGYPP